MDQSPAAVAQVLDHELIVRKQKLILAVIADDRDTVERLLGEGVPVDSKNSEGVSTLHWASSEGVLNMIRLLIKRGGDVNAVDKRGLTPLHSAAAHGQTEAVRELIRNGACKSAIAGTFGSPLQQAHLNGHTKTVKALLELEGSEEELAKSRNSLKPVVLEGDNIKTSASFGVTPAMSALLFGDEEIFSKIVMSNHESIKDRDKFSVSTFEHCFIGGHANKLRSFCEACKISSKGQDLKGALATLIKQGLVDRHKVLCLCAISGDSAFLDDQFMDLVAPNACAMPAAMRCAKFYFFNGVMFLDKLAIPDECSIHPLHMSLLALKCCEMGFATLSVQLGVKNHRQFITTLLSRPVLKKAVNETFCNGQTPLDLAQQFELHDVAQLIERAGGRPGIWTDIPREIEARHPTALLQVKVAYASIRAIAEDGKQGFVTIRNVLFNALQLATVETEVQTDSMLDSMWHPNAVIVGADVGPETDEHEYKSLMVPKDKSKKPPTMRPCEDISELLNKVENHKKEINAMMNHHTGGTVHFGIQDKDNTVEEGLVLNQQSVVIDRLQTKVSQILQEFYPAVQSGFVTIQRIDLMNNARERTGRWRFDIRVSPFGRVVLLSRKQTTAYYRQGANSEPMPADMLIERLRDEM